MCHLIYCVLGVVAQSLLKPSIQTCLRGGNEKVRKGITFQSWLPFLFMHVLFWVYIWLANMCSAFVCKNKNSSVISSFLWLFITPNKADHGAPVYYVIRQLCLLLNLIIFLFLRASLQDSFLWEVLFLSPPGSHRSQCPPHHQSCSTVSGPAFLGCSACIAPLPVAETRTHIKRKTVRTLWSGPFYSKERYCFAAAGSGHRLQSLSQLQTPLYTRVF